MIGRVRFVQPGEAFFVLVPREMAGIDDDAAQAGAMAAHVLGQGMDHDVGAVFERPAQIRGRHGVVHDQWYALGVGDGGQGAEIDHVRRRIADGFAKYRLGLAVDQAAHGVDVAIVGETRFDTETRQGMREQIVGAAVQGRGGDDVVADLRDRHQRVGDGRRTGGYRQRADPAFHGRDALFEHGGGGIHDPGVDVARHLQVEQIGAVLSVVERVGGGLVNGNGNGLGGGFRGIAAVDGDGFDFHWFVFPSVVVDLQSLDGGIRKCPVGRRCW